MSQVIKNYSRVAPERMHDVRANAHGLGILYTVEVELCRLVGCWIARTPELPEKMLLGRILYEDAEHAERLEKRLIELRVAPDKLPELRQRTAGILLELERAPDPASFLSGLFHVAKPALVADLRRHLDGCPPYVDEPSARMLRQLIAEEEDHLSSGLALLADRGIGADAAVSGGGWDMFAEDGGLKRNEFVGRDPVPLSSPHWPETVTKLAFEQPMPDFPSDFDTAMRRCIHDLVFSETEALDIFGRYVYEFPELPWAFHAEAARIAWDEARHVELLLNVLERYGGHVGEFPAKAPGYEEYVREPTPLRKILMVNVIAEGEVSTDTQTQHRDAFRELGDELSAILKDYEMADEIVHGQFGGKWARWIAEQSGDDLDEALAAARNSLEQFKSMHDDEGGDSAIPLVRLGADETGPGRVVNVTA
ncbi:MAG: ferritin-like domain-containing protein, partial [Gaiellaceae bacterium]